MTEQEQLQIIQQQNQHYLDVILRRERLQLIDKRNFYLNEKRKSILDRSISIVECDNMIAEIDEHLKLINPLLK